MTLDYRASTVPAYRPTSSSSNNRPRSFTPRSSSEQGSVSSDETGRTSFIDEAQTTYNILLILREDTQHLISLRNENLIELEDKSELTEDETSRKTALLACINESITSATRSITQLGPYLDKHRWPAAGRPEIPGPQRRSFIIAFKPRHRRSKSSSGRATSPHVSEDGQSILSPEELFSWTLALTAQHTAVLVATERLATFLEYGIANVSEEERRRRDARASWWEQRRGGFENVDLLQSLLSRPRKTFGEASTAENATVATSSTSAELRGDGDGTTENLTPIIEHDDGRSETLFSEAFTPPTLTLTPKGLSARPRQERMGSLQYDEGFSVRRVVTEPLVYSTPEKQLTNETRLSRMETFGSEKPTIPLSRFSIPEQRLQIATESLFPVASWPDTLSEQVTKELKQGYVGSAATGLLSEHDNLFAAGAPALAESVQFTSPLAPSANQGQSGLSLSPSPGAKTVYAPYTPLDPESTSLFTQHALTVPTSKTLQPLIQELNHMLISPDQRAQNVALRVSPVEDNSRRSIAPVIEGLDNMVVSPVETESSAGTQALLGVSPITLTESHERASQDDAGGHMAWLVYMERKQAMSASRWSLRRAKTSEV